MPITKRVETLNTIDETLELLRNKKRLTPTEHFAEMCIKDAKEYILDYSKELSTTEIEDKYRLYSVFLKVMGDFTEKFSKESMYVFSAIGYRFLEELSNEFDYAVLSDYARILKNTSSDILDSIEEEVGSDNE